MPQRAEGMEMPQMGEIPQRTAGMEMPQRAEGGEMPQRGGMFGGGSKPLVDTLLADEALLARYEGYLREIADTYLTEEYMAAAVTEIHGLIAPYVEQDATAFYTFEEFEQCCSIDAADPYSMVYYAVNMAESIHTQLAGGEPTFDASSLKGGGMFGGRGGKGGGMPDFGGGMPDFGGEMPAFGGGMPDFDGEMPDFGGEMPAQEKSQGAEDTPRERGFRGMPHGREKQVELKEVLPEILLCSGIFLAGLMVAIVYRRKKKLR